MEKSVAREKNNTISITYKDEWYKGKPNWKKSPDSGNPKDDVQITNHQDNYESSISGSMERVPEGIDKPNINQMISKSESVEISSR